MKKIIRPTTASFREKGSKFIGFLFPAETKEAFQNKLEEVKSKYPDATHHCYSWRLDPVNLEEFTQDDGEPNGTAGLPILNQLKSHDVINAGLIIVRYYGGTNLGKSGLIKAYGEAANLCLENADLKSIQLIWKVEITYPYSEQNLIEKMVHQFNLNELESTYLENVTLIFACPVEHQESLEKSLEQLSHRGIKTIFLEKDYI